MNCETFTTEINGHKYTYTQLPASKSLSLKYLLAGILGSAITDILPYIGSSKEEQTKAFGDAMVNIFSNNDPDKIVDIIKRIMEPAFKDGERINIDNHFTGETEEMYQVLMWILNKEYGSFFTGVGAMF